MKDIAKRFAQNPLLMPRDLKPSSPELQIISLLNPAAFKLGDRICLLVRVAESLSQKEGVLFFPIINSLGKVEIIEVPLNDPELIYNDARIVNYRGLDYLTTISHLRLLSSYDGVKFTEENDHSSLFGVGELERYGIEDCRVTLLDETFYLTYTAVSDSGVGVGLRKTRDWETFEHCGMILPPHNKDCAIFEEKIRDKFYCLHRPSSKEIGGNYIWIAESPDGNFWGNHKCIIKTRPGLWDSARVGAGASPIKTKAGWLAIYHGANAEHQYCLGAFLLDIENPSIVLGRTISPIMLPTEHYELSGFFGFVVFTNGHIIDGDELTVYYGAADEFVCGAKFSINEILSMIEPV